MDGSVGEAVDRHVKIGIVLTPDDLGWTVDVDGFGTSLVSGYHILDDDRESTFTFEVDVMTHLIT